MIMCLKITGYLLFLYRLPRISSSGFVNIHDLLENVVAIHPEYLIIDDLNLHLDTYSTAISTFNDILVSLNENNTFLSPYTYMVTGLISS